MIPHRGDADQVSASVLAILGALGAIVLMFTHESDLAITAAVAVSVIAAVLAVALMVRAQRKTGEGS